MNQNKRLFFTCLVVAGLCQAVSFGLDRQPLLALATFLPISGMILARKPAFAGLAYLSLAGFAALSAAGILLKTPALPLILASTAALAAWDLLLESHEAAAHGEPLGNSPFESSHLKSLGLAVGLGLLGAGVGVWIHWQAPFLVTLALVVLTLFCLDRVLHDVA